MARRMAYMYPVTIPESGSGFSMKLTTQLRRIGPIKPAVFQSSFSSDSHFFLTCWATVHQCTGWDIRAGQTLHLDVVIDLCRFSWSVDWPRGRKAPCWNSFWTLTLIWPPPKSEDLFALKTLGIDYLYDLQQESRTENILSKKWKYFFLSITIYCLPALY